MMHDATTELFQTNCSAQEMPHAVITWGLTDNVWMQLPFKTSTVLPLRRQGVAVPMNK